MPSADYYRKQAQLFAKLTLCTNNPATVARYRVLAFEYLARAEQLDPSLNPFRSMLEAGGGSDTERSG